MSLWLNFPECLKVSDPVSAMHSHPVGQQTLSLVHGMMEQALSDYYL